eukprot:CAMPEP_0172299484 /NCGR_PEP_ID=MMETSP1058-20130122/1775_1 /TAXON_ID=83371 /ORGANISM="Detonula confervacea, Strain CCMP 353" /LENGTH=332 /DNA_ID=CAMNT_0013008941 /DNA_START=70 /DNA_END=1069 /DNA_ORIENTATION=-
MASSIPAGIALLMLHGGSFTATAFAPQLYSHHHSIIAHQSSTRWQESQQSNTSPTSSSSWALCMSEQPPDDEGADLAAAFFKSVSDRKISFEGDEIDFADAEDEEMDNGGDNASEELDDDDDAILREYDVSSEGSLTDEQIYDEVKDRVFESAGAFVELTKGAEEGGDGDEGASKVYQPPINIPDSGLTAGEVVELVLSALRNNDVPSPDYGVEILFGYSSPESQIVEQLETDGLTPSQYRTFLGMSEDNLALFEHTTAMIDKADFSPDSLKGYFTARLITGGRTSTDDVSVNFILSTSGTNDDDCWLIDSMLIRPSKLNGGGDVEKDEGLQ